MYPRIPVLLFACSVASAAQAQVVCPPAPATERQLLVSSRYVGYYSSQGLTTYNQAIRRAVIMIHGQGRNAASYYDTLAKAACTAESLAYAPNATQETILIAPHFLNEEDAVPADYHRWSSNKWAAGNYSETGTAVSSYTVIDTFVGRLIGSIRWLDPLGTVRKTFPNLETIVIAGHSAGGQFAHRYAATNGRDGNLGTVRMRYVVANPSSYLYLDDFRPYFDYASGVGDPYRLVTTPLVSAYVRNPGFSDAPLCPTSYNDWKYGLSELNTYAGAVGASTIRQRLVNRTVTVLLGTADNDPNHPDLDTSCPARLQGAHRYERGVRLVDYLNGRYPLHRHSMEEVVGAGHSAGEMFGLPPGGGAPTGVAALFID